MTKLQALKELNYLIDRLIIKGLKTKAQKSEFQRLCRLHKELVSSL